MLKIYTSTVYWYKNKPDMLDVSVKTGTVGKIFAPTWEMVNKWMASEKTLADMIEYAIAYREMMRKSFRNNYKEWIELLQKEQIVFLCFCKADEFCHRFLLASILCIQGAEYMGEIMKDGSIRNATKDEVQRWIQWFKQNK